MSADDARRLFDEMPHREKRRSATPVSLPDRIGALPDSILHHLLSFLPAQEAVRTCVLARRWRHLWRFTTGLRIDHGENFEFERLRKFVEHLLILRERTNLDTVEFKIGEPFEEDVLDDLEYYVNLWIRFAVMCKVRVLNLDNFKHDLCLDKLPVSRHLRTLDLDSVTLETFLDFASCPALEDLKMNNCLIRAGKISSHSLKHLSITGCASDSDHQLHVSTPDLVSLKLHDFSGTTPFLENMALLETACIYLGDECNERCFNYDDSGVPCGSSDNACENCDRTNDNCSSGCVLLGGISSARHLELMSESGKLVFARDLKQCPTFGNLKALLLNKYWCEAPDLDPLACILKNSPVLEKLTLELFYKGLDRHVKMKGRYSSMEGPFAISEHLNMVEVKCDKIDEKILKVLKFLTALNIRFGFE